MAHSETIRSTFGTSSDKSPKEEVLSAEDVVPKIEDELALEHLLNPPALEQVNLPRLEPKDIKTEAMPLDVDTEAVEAEEFKDNVEQAEFNSYRVHEELSKNYLKTLGEKLKNGFFSHKENM